MPTFTYQATDAAGKAVRGRMEAQDPAAVALRLQELRLYPLRVRREDEQEEERSLSFAGVTGRRGRTLSYFTNQLAVLLEAGLPLDRCLEIAAELAEDPRLRGVAARVHRKVQEGSSLADALAEHPRVFSDLYVSMVHAGEATGALDLILKRLAEFLDEWQRIKDVITSALLYPVFLVFFSTVAVTALLVFVIPGFAENFTDMMDVLPAPTRALIALSGALRSYWWAWAGGAAAAVLGAWSFMRSRPGRLWWDRRVLTLPLLGDLVTKVQVSRFARVLGTLVRSGVPILGALEIVTGTLTNSVFSRSLARVQSGLKEGQGVSGPLRAADVFPPLFIHMVTVGEETGRLEEMLLAIAATYDREVETAAKRLLSLMEPVIIVVMGTVIGAIILSILWAIFSVNQMAF